MTSPFVRRVLGAFLAYALAVAVSPAAESVRTPSSKGKASISTSKSSRGQAPASRTGGRGILPDPALLDGSNHPPEKRPEFGMIGDFELPGDENARNGRVGGPQQGGGGQSPQSQGGLPGVAAGGLPSLGGGAPSLPEIPELPPEQAAGGGQGGGPENAAAGGKQVEGQGEQGGQPQGQQVAELQGEGGGPESGEIGEKPQEVAIGDSAMQIKTIESGAASVGGQQQAGKTQQHEKTPGTGGKAAQGNNSNRGAERGRVMPAGL